MFHTFIMFFLMCALGMATVGGLAIGGIWVWFFIKKWISEWKNK